MEVAGNDATKIFEGLQVAPGGPENIFRKGMTQYLVNTNTLAAQSTATENPDWGDGGFIQLFIPNYQEVLTPIWTLLLTNRGD